MADRTRALMRADREWELRENQYSGKLTSISQHAPVARPTQQQSAEATKTYPLARRVQRRIRRVQRRVRRAPARNGSAIGSGLLIAGEKPRPPRRRRARTASSRWPVRT